MTLVSIGVSVIAVFVLANASSAQPVLSPDPRRDLELKKMQADLDRSDLEKQKLQAEIDKAKLEKNKLEQEIEKLQREVAQLKTTTFAAQIGRAHV